MSLQYSARDFVRGALYECGVLSSNQVPDGPDLAWGFQLLNELLDSWQVQQLTTLVQQRTVYPLVSGQGSPENPYTIGPGGNFDTTPSDRPDLIRSARTLLQNSVPPVEIPLAIITDDMYSAEQIKDLSTQLANYLYYQKTVPLGTIQLWPVPNDGTNALVLYSDLLTPIFATFDSVYLCPPSYATAIRLNLAEALLSSFGVPPARGQLIMQRANLALMTLKDGNANAKMADLLIDPAMTQPKNRWGTYNILSDQGS